MMVYFITNIESVSMYMLILLYATSLLARQHFTLIPNLLYLVSILGFFIINVNRDNSFEEFDSHFIPLLLISIMICFGTFLIKECLFVKKAKVDTVGNTALASKHIKLDSISTAITDDDLNLITPVAKANLNTQNVVNATNMNFLEQTAPIQEMNNKSIDIKDAPQDTAIHSNDISIFMQDVKDKILYKEELRIVEGEINSRIDYVEQNVNGMRNDVQVLVNRMAQLLDVLALAVQKYKIYKV